MSNTKYLTTPIFYANNTPHIGHLYTGLVCDIWRQANIVMNKKCFLSSGMDEHGQKVYQSAQNNGLEAQEYVDSINKFFVGFFDKYHVRYDYWVRTTDENHKKSAQIFWKKLEKRGFIYKNKYKGWYSISDEHYLDIADDYVSTSANIVWREEECYYFKLSAFQDKLIEYYEKNIDFIYPKARYNEAIGFINQGLKDFSISRPKDRLFWGTDVPDEENQVMYVWIDALVNYLSLIGYPDEKYKNYWPAIHVIGKDILRFHAVYWPALLMAAEIELPKQIIVHGWWLNGDQKVSKSLNNAIDINGLTEVYGSDSMRYFLLSNMTLGEDANFKEELFHSVVNSALSNKFGNLFLRLVGVANTNKIKLLEVFELDKDLSEFLASLTKEMERFVDDIMFFDGYIKQFLLSLDFLNNYINEKAIWKQSQSDLEKSLYSLLYCFKVMSTIFSPMFPEASQKIADYFDIDLFLSDASKHKNIEIKQGIILFPRVA